MCCGYSAHPVSSWISWQCCWRVEGQSPSGSHYNDQVCRAAAPQCFSRLSGILWILCASVSEYQRLCSVSFPAGRTYTVWTRSIFGVNIYPSLLLLCVNTNTAEENGCFTSVRFFSRKWVEFLALVFLNWVTYLDWAPLGWMLRRRISGGGLWKTAGCPEHRVCRQTWLY